jgi:hypothetical protein
VPRGAVSCHLQLGFLNHRPQTDAIATLCRIVKPVETWNMTLKLMFTKGICIGNIDNIVLLGIN